MHDPRDDPPPRGKPLVRLCAAFVLTGAVTALIGPFVAEAARRWSLSESIAGLFFPAQFAAALTGTLGIGRAAARFGYPRVFRLSLLLMAAGVALAPWGPPPLALAAVALYGAGIGLNVPAANAWAAGAGGHAVEFSLVRLNLAWGLGAVLGPAAVAFSMTRWSLEATWMALAAALVFAAGLQGGGCAKERLRPVAEDASRSPAAAASGAAWVSAAALFLYVGTENAFSGWLPLLAMQAYGRNAPAGGLAVSVFWASLLAARALVAVAIRRVPPGACIQAGLALFLAGALAAATGGRLELLWAGAAAAGFGLGPVFPLAVAAYYRKSGAAAGRRLGAVFASSALGGAAIPPAAGVVMDLAGTAAAGMAVPIFTAVLLAVLFRKRG